MIEQPLLKKEIAVPRNKDSDIHWESPVKVQPCCNGTDISLHDLVAISFMLRLAKLGLFQVPRSISRY